MTQPKTVLDRLRARGEEVFAKVSNELMTNPHFLKAMQGALQGKEKIDQAVVRAMKAMNVPTRQDLRKALQRIDALETEVAALKAKARTARPAPRPKRGAAPRKPAPAAPLEMPPPAAPKPPSE